MYRNPSQRRSQGRTDSISISCRFVATDQWFRTHIDPSWTVFELKRHLLARCVGGVPLAPATTSSGPRLLVPSPPGRVTLAGLVRAPHSSAIKSGARPSTAPHVTNDDHSRRKPRLSLKVVPGLSKPAPRTVTIHPPTPGLGFGPPFLSATGPQPAPPIYFSPRNPLSSPELSPPRFAPQQTLDDESSPSSPNTQLDAASISSRSTVALGYSQPHSHTTSPTFSSGTSPPSRPFSPTSLPAPVESQPLFSPDHHLIFGDFVATSPSATSLRARSTPPLVRAMSTPPSPYSPKPPTPTKSRPAFLHHSVPPPNTPPAASTSTACSPPLSSSLQSRYEFSRPGAESQLSSRSELTAESHSTRSPLLSAAEFLDLEGPDVEHTNVKNTDASHDFATRSPSPPGPRLLKAGVELLSTGKMRGGGGVSGKDERRGTRDEVARTDWEDEFRLVSFGMGCVLDEHVSVADLKIRPGELFEIQRSNAIVHLARPSYTQPYFEAPVYIIKRTQSSASHHHHHYQQPRSHTSHNNYSHPLPHPHPRPHQHHVQPLRDYAPPPPPPPPLEPISPIDPGPSASTRLRSGTVTARDMWDTGNNAWDQDQAGDDEQDWAELELSGLEGVGGGPGTAGSGSTAKGSSGWNDAATDGAGTTEKVEWKLRWLVMREGRLALFRQRGGQQLCSRSLTSLLSAQQLPAVPSLGSLPRHYISVHFTGSSRRERERDAEVGVRMMDGAAHAHLLRVLLRIINTPGAHTFLPTDTPYISSAPLASQYPEWRQHIVQRAWLAARGTAQMHAGNVAGPWMRVPWMAWTEKEAAEAFDDSDESEATGSPSSDGDGLYDYINEEELPTEDARDDDSEIEWDVEGWRAWESENAFGAWAAGSAWLKGKAESLGSGRPRSRSLAAPMSRSASQQQQKPQQQQQHNASQSAYPHPQQQYVYQPRAPDALLSPVSTVSSDLSSVSPSARRARSSTIAGPPPDSPGSTSPSAWSPVSASGPGLGLGLGLGMTVGTRRPPTSGSTGAGIETVLRNSEPVRRASAQAGRSSQPRSEAERRGSANSLEMQRAAPSSRRAVTSPAPGTGVVTKFA